MFRRLLYKAISQTSGEDNRASIFLDQVVIYGWPSIRLIDFSKLFTASTEIYLQAIQRQCRVYPVITGGPTLHIGLFNNKKKVK